MKLRRSIRNLRSGLRRRVRQGNPMARYDALPEGLRHWLSEAALPWSPASALRLWQQAIAEGAGPEGARARLSRAEAALLARDACRIWGAGHPQAATDTRRMPQNSA